MDKPAIEQILNIFIVVRDIDASITTYERDYGIGPWTFLDMSSDAVPQKWVREQACDYQVRIATCDALNVGLALVQPLDDDSVFAEHLRDHGPGVFHLLVTMRNGYDATMALADARGMPVLQRGIAATGVEYAHVDFTADLGVVLETFKLPGQ